ncbi:MAG: hydroxymethylglutaryl-CoA synthase family protein [Alphaproteobacteria bacterium]|nr:hydroxymethylglutaryl-CoA synthase family protein [Alphaproteobacteria bacterium]
MDAGIDDLDVFAGSCAIDTETLVAGRDGIRPKDARHVGFARRSVLAPFEDPVTLAVDAARNVVEEAGPRRFELLIVATETGLDFARPLATAVHHHLGLPRRCRTMELKHACYAGTAALQLACAWARDGGDPDRRALVVTTDVARFHPNDPAELSSGTAAVAMVVGLRPRVLVLEPTSGIATDDVFDVARPTRTFEHVHAARSLAAYLDLLEAAWQDWGSRHAVRDPRQAFDRYLFHAPVLSLVRQLHRQLLETADPEIDETALAADFEARVAPALGWLRQVGNVYSGNLYTSLAGLCADTDPPGGTRVGLFSYGSGSCAEVVRGHVVDGAGARVRRLGIGDRLARRRPLDLATYERFMRRAAELYDSPAFDPVPADVGDLRESLRGTGRLVLSEVAGWHRSYHRA